MNNFIRVISAGIFAINLVACDSGSNNTPPHLSNEEAFNLCDPEIKRAIDRAATDAEAYTAGMDTMRNCMARHGFHD